MKKRLKIIGYSFCAILVCVAALNVYLKPEIMFNNVENSTKNNESRHSFDVYSLKLTPDNFSIPDSLFNEKTGSWIPARIREIDVYIPKEEKAKPITNTIMSGLYAILFLGSIVMIFFNFVRIMNSVEKSAVFVWINVRRLRLIGLGFIVCFISDAVNLIYDSILTKDLVKISDYSIIMETFSMSFLIEGMIAFIIAEIFAVGLRLKEEQDLTI